MAELRIKGKQIRAFVNSDAYKKLVTESKQFGLTLSQYAGLKLSGYKILQESTQKSG